MAIKTTDKANPTSSVQADPGRKLVRTGIKTVATATGQDDPDRMEVINTVQGRLRSRFSDARDSAMRKLRRTNNTIGEAYKDENRITHRGDELQVSVSKKTLQQRADAKAAKEAKAAKKAKQDKFWAKIQAQRDAAKKPVSEGFWTRERPKAGEAPRDEQDEMQKVLKKHGYEYSEKSKNKLGYHQTLRKWHHKDGTHVQVHKMDLRAKGPAASVSDGTRHHTANALDRHLTSKHGVKEQVMTPRQASTYRSYAKDGIYGTPNDNHSKSDVKATRDWVDTRGKEPAFRGLAHPMAKIAQDAEHNIKRSDRWKASKRLKAVKEQTLHELTGKGKLEKIRDYHNNMDKHFSAKAGGHDERGETEKGNKAAIKATSHYFKSERASALKKVRDGGFKAKQAGKQSSKILRQDGKNLGEEVELINESRKRVEITKDEYAKLKDRHVKANRYVGHHNTAHVYHDPEKGHVVDQTWSHPDHNLPTIEKHRATGKHYKFMKEEVELIETHVVHFNYDDPTGKGTASVRVKIKAKSPGIAKARAMAKLKSWPNGISDYKNLKHVRTTKAKD